MEKKKIDYEKLEDMPVDAYIAPTEISDDKLLEKLLSTPDEVTKQVYMKRFDTYFTVKAISSEEYSRLENRCKYPVKNKRTHQIEEKTNQEMLSNLLIVTACVKPNWNEPRLLEKYGTSDPAKVIRKRLYIGEISQLTEAIMDASGFDDGLEEAKNSFSEAENQA